MEWPTRTIRSTAMGQRDDERAEQVSELGAGVGDRLAGRVAHGQRGRAMGAHHVEVGLTPHRLVVAQAVHEHDHGRAGTRRPARGRRSRSPRSPRGLPRWRSDIGTVSARTRSSSTRRSPKAAPSAASQADGRWVLGRRPRLRRRRRLEQGRRHGSHPTGPVSTAAKWNRAICADASKGSLAHRTERGQPRADHPVRPRACRPRPGSPGRRPHRGMRGRGALPTVHQWTPGRRHRAASARRRDHRPGRSIPRACRSGGPCDHLPAQPHNTDTGRTHRANCAEVTNRAPDTHPAPLPSGPSRSVRAPRPPEHVRCPDTCVRCEPGPVRIRPIRPPTAHRSVASPDGSPGHAPPSGVSVDPVTHAVTFRVDLDARCTPRRVWFHLRDFGADPTFHLEGDQWVARIPRPPVDRLEYLLVLEWADGGESMVTDPANAHRVRSVFGDKSVIEFPGYARPWWLAVADAADAQARRDAEADAAAARRAATTGRPRTRTRPASRHPHGSPGADGRGPPVDPGRRRPRPAATSAVPARAWPRCASVPRSAAATSGSGARPQRRSHPAGALVVDPADGRGPRPGGGRGRRRAAPRPRRLDARASPCRCSWSMTDPSTPTWPSCCAT